MPFGIGKNKSKSSEDKSKSKEDTSKSSKDKSESKEDRRSARFSLSGLAELFKQKAGSFEPKGSLIPEEPEPEKTVVEETKEIDPRRFSLPLGSIAAPIDAAVDMRSSLVLDAGGDLFLKTLKEELLDEKHPSNTEILIGIHLLEVELQKLAQQKDETKVTQRASVRLSTADIASYKKGQESVESGTLLRTKRSSAISRRRPLARKSTADISSLLPLPTQTNLDELFVCGLTTLLLNNTLTKEQLISGIDCLNAYKKEDSPVADVESSTVLELSRVTRVSVALDHETIHHMRKVDAAIIPPKDESVVSTPNELDYYSSPIGGLCDKALLVGLIHGCTKENIQTLAKRLEHVTELDLSSQDLNDADIELLAESLQENKTIKALNLSHNNISKLGPLASWLKTNSSITAIDLSNNQISDNPDSLGTLGKALPYNSTLLEINLSENSRITSSGITLFAIDIEENQTLTKVIFPNNPGCVEKLNEILSQNLAETNGVITIIGDRIKDKDFEQLILLLKTHSTIPITINVDDTIKTTLENSLEEVNKKKAELISTYLNSREVLRITGKLENYEIFALTKFLPNTAITEVILSDLHITSSKIEKVGHSENNISIPLRKKIQLILAKNKKLQQVTPPIPKPDSSDQSFFGFTPTIAKTSVVTTCVATLTTPETSSKLTDPQTSHTPSETCLSASESHSSIPHSDVLESRSPPSDDASQLNGPPPPKAEGPTDLATLATVDLHDPDILAQFGLS